MKGKPRVRAGKVRDVQRKLDEHFLPSTRGESKKLIDDVKRFRSGHEHLLQLHINVHEEKLDTESLKKEISDITGLLDASEPTRLQKAKTLAKAFIGKPNQEHWTRTVLLSRRVRLLKDLSNVFDIEHLTEPERESAIKGMRTKQLLLDNYLSKLGSHLQSLKH